MHITKPGEAINPSQTAFDFTEKV